MTKGGIRMPDDDVKSYYAGGTGSDALDNAIGALNAQGDNINRKTRETYANFANLYEQIYNNEFNAEQATLEYERSSASNQVRLMMDAGMTRQAALATLQGGSSQSAAQASGGGAGATGREGIDPVQAALAGVSIIGSFCGIAQGFKALGLTAKQAQSVVNLNEIQAKMVGSQNNLVGEYLKQQKYANMYAKAQHFVSQFSDYDSDKMNTPQDVISFMKSKYEQFTGTSLDLSSQYAGDDAGLQQAMSQQYFDGADGLQIPFSEFNKNVVPFLNQYYEDPSYLGQNFLNEGNITEQESRWIYQQKEMELSFTNEQIKGITQNIQLQKQQIRESQSREAELDAETNLLGEQATTERLTRPERLKLLRSETNLKDAQAEQSGEAAQALSWQNYFASATIDQTTYLENLRLTKDIAIMSKLNSPDALEKQLGTILSNIDSAYALAAQAKMWNEANDEYWSSHPDEVDMWAFMTSENFAQALQNNIIRAQDKQNQFNSQTDIMAVRAATECIGNIMHIGVVL